MNKKTKRLVIVLIIAALLLMFVPLFALKGASFGGSDDAGSQMVESVDSGYKPWATPVLETWIHGEIPSEMETLLFCVQTGIGVGIISFIMGRLVERKKWTDREEEKDERGNAAGKLRDYVSEDARE